MAKNLLIKIALLVLGTIPFGLTAQNLIYKFKSKVELRDWKLSSKAYKEVTYLEGASIELYEGSKLITKTNSDKDGNFTLDLPPSGNFTLMVNSPGYNSRRFSLNCNSIIIKNGEADFIPSVDVTGFISTKTIKDVKDMGISNPTVLMANEKSEVYKYNGLNFPVNVNDGDLKLIQKFCTCNKLGDMALQNKNYELAKIYYIMATNMMEKEEYPKDQLKRVEDGLKEKMFAEKEAMRSKGRTGSSKKQVKTPVTVTPQYNSNQKSGTGGHKVLPVLGGKK